MTKAFIWSIFFFNLIHNILNKNKGWCFENYSLDFETRELIDVIPPALEWGGMEEGVCNI